MQITREMNSSRPPPPPLLYTLNFLDIPFSTDKVGDWLN